MAVPHIDAQPDLISITLPPDGSVTLPAELVRAAGFAEGVTITATVEHGGLRLLPQPPPPALKKQPLIDLYNDFAAVREEVLASGMSDEELYELIDEAIAASRRARPIPAE